MRIPLTKLSESADRYNSWKDIAVPESRMSREDLFPPYESTGMEGPGLLTEEQKSIDSKRKSMLKAVSKEPLDFAFDRAIGKNDAVYSNFIEMILAAKRKTGRIVVRDAGEITGYATGFMVSENLLLTNWHVFRSESAVSDSEVQFFYEYDLNGTPGQPIAFRLNTNLFYHSSEPLDYCFVGVESLDLTQQYPLSSIGYIFLDPAIGKLGNVKEEALNIIHHPNGDFKQLSIRENLLTQKLDKTIWYKTDTAQGSSGSPVFNDQWQVVALHHMGIPRKKGNAFVDKKGEVFYADEDGQVDASRIVWEANEGIRISAILADLSASLPDSGAVRELKVPPKPPVSHPVPITETQLPARAPENPQSVASNEIRISLPASLVETKGTVHIAISNQSTAVQTTTDTSAVSSLEHELKKLEEEMDFSLCKGYQPDFLGVNVPIPKPKAALKKFISKIRNSNATVLHYHHYSLLFHSVRMMPVMSVINVDGDPAKRKDDSERSDKWLKDNRLDQDMQLGDTFYKLSKFDRGHMSRREDANWGNTPEEAMLFANLTCMYTNACPQVPGLNQSSRKGLWGKLEQVILENGAQKETGKLGRISVINGPIFKSDDPVFRGIQVPLNFYKIILWLNDNQKLQATAFKLSQEKLVGDIDFQEAIDIHENREFREHQCSIKWLEKVTGINFSGIAKYDTFTGAQSDHLELVSVEHLKTFVASQINS